MVDIEEIKRGQIPKHIAIIMDGNRRWAAKNRLDILKGHEAGANVLKTLLDFLSSDSGINIKTIT